MKDALAVILGMTNATSMLLAVLGKPAAWIIVIIAQATFIVYVVITEQWFILIGGQPICFIIGIYGAWRWLTKGVHYDRKRELVDK